MIRPLSFGGVALHRYSGDIYDAKTTSSEDDRAMIHALTALMNSSMQPTAQYSTTLVYQTRWGNYVLKVRPLEDGVHVNWRDKLVQSGPERTVDVFLTEGTVSDSEKNSLSRLMDKVREKQNGASTRKETGFRSLIPDAVKALSEVNRFNWVASEDEVIRDLPLDPATDSTQYGFNLFLRRPDTER